MSSTEPLQVMSFRIGGMLFCVPVTQVEAIVEVPKLTSLPLLPTFALGVFQYRNEVAAVIDLGVLLEVPREAEAAKPCLIMSRIQQQAAGFLVDTVLDLLDTTLYTWTTVPVVHAGQQVELALVREQEMFLLLDFEDMDELHRMMQDVKQGRARGLPHESKETTAPSHATAPAPEVIEETAPVPDATPMVIEASPLPHEEPPPSEPVSSVVSEPDIPAGVVEPMPAQDVMANINSEPSVDELNLSESEYDELVNVVSAVDADDPAAGEGPVTVAALLDSVNDIHSILRSDSTAPIPVADIEEMEPAEDAITLGAAAARGVKSDYVISDEPADYVDDEFPEAAESPQVISQNGHHIHTSSSRRPLIVRAEPDPVSTQRKMFLFGIVASLIVLGLMWWGLHVVDQKRLRTDKTQIDEVVAPIVIAQGPESTAVQDNEITIIEKKDGPERLLVELPEHEMHVIRAESMDKNHPLQAASPEEMLHHVVHGDTLWDIARKYLKNPFRYPELARNSAINNPNLIYPGDVVRITRRPVRGAAK